eukprot:Nitzschia sp. Nitz4//scaffold363_size14950//383//8108//NITZ4_008904-RA/size14950-snap-gene-0.0-mRNA-1//1//CDS//3329549257//2211//frame0
MDPEVFHCMFLLLLPATDSEPLSRSMGKHRTLFARSQETFSVPVSHQFTGVAFCQNSSSRQIEFATMTNTPFVPPFDDKSDQDISADGASNYTGSAESLHQIGKKLFVRHQHNETFGQKESKAVVYGKLLMIMILLTVAATASAVVYTYTVREQENEFDVIFEDSAHQFESVFHLNAKKVFKALNAFGKQMTSQATAANATWPYVTIPGFEALAVDIREQTGADTVMMAHIVTEEQRTEWEAYTQHYGAAWIQESIDYNPDEYEDIIAFTMPYIFDDSFPNPSDGPKEGYEYYVPVWQSSPLEWAEYANYDALDYPDFVHVYDNIIQRNSLVMGRVMNLGDEDAGPLSMVSVPIYNQSVPEPTLDMIVGFFANTFLWQEFFSDISISGYAKIYLVVHNSCDQTFSYFAEGSSLSYLGEGDIHELEYDNHELVVSFSGFEVEMECLYSVSIYPSKDFVSSFDSKNPITYTVSVASIFVFTIVVFLVYDCLVERRQDKVLSTAERSTAIVSSLFPKDVADRLMEVQRQETAKKLRESNGGKAIAELFPSATVMFADIVGFTAWSSEREPQQVFELLEEIYASFDKMAKRQKIFKVETIGDCYMAAAGLPEKRDDHAVAMAVFAKDCLQKFHVVVRSLESQLGPSTGDLGLRIGVHSGPVTAGVLRGDKARFQLFGDTVNTAARMESTGTSDKIQLSSETARLVAEGFRKDVWTVPRTDQIEAKGKGKLQTFWLEYSVNETISLASHSTMSSTDSVSASGSQEVIDQESSVIHIPDSEKRKQDRSVQWITSMLQRFLQRVIAMRGGVNDATLDTASLPRLRHGEVRPLDEVVEIINLDTQRERAYPADPNLIEIPAIVKEQLQDYVEKIAGSYHDNPFHNFEHATHVAMSVTKLLSRVVSPEVRLGEDNANYVASNEELHAYTYGITSDPLAQFAVVFSALIHDADHPGVPNTVLVKERAPNALCYRSQSVAEQTSVDLAWRLLSEPCYSELRACIYQTREEMYRFRQVVVNAVMATDIVDKQLGAARKARWEKAFSKDCRDNSSQHLEYKVDTLNRKATIVIEHMIQASDVAHTMQHWHIYIRWNERFFDECYNNFLTGRTDKDPSVDWYESELGFFDFYLIPLAKKLKECQVFGVSSDEYLNYAEVNRAEWKQKGRRMVESYMEKYKNVPLSPSTVAEMAAIDDKSEEFSADGASNNTSSASGSSMPVLGEAFFVTHNHKESKAVAYGKMTMIALLMTVAATASAVVYTYTHREQQSQFDTIFEGTVHQVESVFLLNTKKVFKALNAFGNHLTSHAIGANATWPYVTIPGFEALAVDIREQTGANAVMMAHIVTEEQRTEWEAYTQQHGAAWIQESIDYNPDDYGDTIAAVTPYIFDDSSWPNPSENPQPGYDYYVAAWQSSPLEGGSIANYDAVSHPDFSQVYNSSFARNSLVMGKVVNLGDENTEPSSLMAVPVYSRPVLNPTMDMIVASFVSTVPWHEFLNDINISGYAKIYLVVRNSCDQTFSYYAEGSTMSYLGMGDIHESEYEDHEIVVSFSGFEKEMKCLYTLSIYPSGEFVESFDSKNPMVYTVAVASIFLFTIAVFLVYDCLVQRRQDKVMSTAERSTAIVSSLFPKDVAERLMDVHRQETAQKIQEVNEGKAIAELFPSATVMFADIVGFTAWSSEREPQQVFELLEEIYSSFDKTAKKQRIFKVETIGDCYMAATGLPEKRDDHAVAMAVFARDCLHKFHVVIRSLESQLGPSTGELGLRIGVHSGPVTAGVLRGEKARFQLFGDTVNTAARMESTGVSGKIQLSSETARLIEGKNRKDIVLIPRIDEIEAKGKGKLRTFWLEEVSNDAETSQPMEAPLSTSTVTSIPVKVAQESPPESSAIYIHPPKKNVDKAVQWTASMLQGHLQRVIAMRGGVNDATLDTRALPRLRHGEVRPLDEVVEIINLDTQREREYPADPNLIEIPAIVQEQLLDYVEKIAESYHNNPFHNFQHASHVAMSVSKLLSRVVSPDSSLGNDKANYIERNETLHTYTFGITSDPLAQFAVVFSALVHDADHPGVPNTVLVKERAPSALCYRNQSVAEQNSVDLAWKLLSKPCYQELRACIYQTRDEMYRFRQVVVNAVLATDIVDKQLGAARKERWAKAFAKDGKDFRTNLEYRVDTLNRKATIVIEHMIQASDVAHTMQHWKVYIRWNERFFDECYQNYLAGRVDQDPSVNWYKGEIGFFDFYIIPLAKKLKECQVFGVSSDEYLNYAECNRAEWEQKGQALVASYLEKYQTK